MKSIWPVWAWTVIALSIAPLVYVTAGMWLDSARLGAVVAGLWILTSLRVGLGTSVALQGRSACAPTIRFLSLRVTAYADLIYVFLLVCVAFWFWAQGLGAGAVLIGGWTAANALALGYKYLPTGPPT